jgi:predicted TIM-barrel fold metal-dependent hydrolase
MNSDSAETVREPEDKFVAMVTAKGDVKLSLSDFHPLSMLKTPVHKIKKPRYPVIDYHNHLDAQNPVDVLHIMDACGIEHIVNITMKVGDEALRIIERFHHADAERFSTIGWTDWTGVESDDFIQVIIDRIDRLREAGIVGFKIWKDLGLTVRDREGHLLQVDDERLALIFDYCGELGIPVMVHIGDPEAFFSPID